MPKPVNVKDPCHDYQNHLVGKLKQVNLMPEKVRRTHVDVNLALRLLLGKPKDQAHSAKRYLTERREQNSPRQSIRPYAPR